MRSEVLVSLLVSGILGDELEVLASDDDGSVHLSRDNGAGQDTATDGDETSEGALLVCILKPKLASLSQYIPVHRYVGSRAPVILSNA